MVQDVVELHEVGLDRLLREQLQQRRLIGELALEGPEADRCVELVEALAERPDPVAIERFADAHPALFCYYLVVQGAQHGDGGELWTFVPFATDQQSQAAAGRAFERQTAQLGLTSAADLLAGEASMRYVAAVMLHALVPRDGSWRFLQAVVSLLREGFVRAEDVRSELTAASSEFRLSTPARRFITYGGDLALDYLRRLIRYIQESTHDPSLTSQEFGLPSFITQALRDSVKLKPREIRMPSAAARIFFDPWNGFGPEIALPPSQEVAEWVLSYDGRQDRFNSSAIREQVSELPLSGRWTATSRRDEDVLTQVTWESLSFGVLLFDEATGEPRLERTSPPGELVALVPPGVSVLIGKTPVIDNYEYPPLSGSWSGYQALRVETKHADELFASYDGKTEQLSTVAETAERAQLLELPVEWVTGPDGSPVFQGWPNLVLPADADPSRWFIRLRFDGDRWSGPASELSKVFGSALSLESKTPAGFLGSCSLSVRGPLGSDFEQTFIIVPGLEFEAPPRPVSGTEHLKVKVSKHQSVELEGISGSSIPFASGESERLVTATSDGQSVDLTFEIPRLKWGVSSTGFAPDELHAQTVRHSFEQLLEHQASLWIRTGKAASFQVALTTPDGRLLQERPEKTTSKRGGRAQVDLTSFFDTIRASSDSTCCVRIRLGNDVEDEVLRLDRRYLVKSFELEVSAGVGFMIFDEVAPAKGRVLRVWEPLRPWSKPRDFAIKDSANGLEGVEVKLSELPPGRFVGELTTAANQEKYPSVEAPETRVFSIESDRINELDALDLITDFPTRALIQSASSEAEAQAITARAFDCLEVLSEMPPGLEVDRRFHNQMLHNTTETLFDKPVRLLREVAFRHRRGSGGSGTSQKAILPILPYACDIPIPGSDRNTRLYSDIWEISSPLAIAFNQTTDRNFWVDKVGWLPGSELPYPGTAFKGPILESPDDYLRKTRLKLVQSGIQLLGISGFEDAIVCWLLSANGDYQPVIEWQQRHRRLLIETGKSWPYQATRAHRSLRPTADGPLQLPADLFGLALNHVTFEDLATRGRPSLAALIEAVDFAPELVDRQVALALVHHLTNEGRWKS